MEVSDLRFIAGWVMVLSILMFLMGLLLLGRFVESDKKTKGPGPDVWHMGFPNMLTTSYYRGFGKKIVRLNQLSLLLLLSCGAFIFFTAE